MWRRLGSGLFHLLRNLFLQPSPVSFDLLLDAGFVCDPRSLCRILHEPGSVAIFGNRKMTTAKISERKMLFEGAVSKHAKTIIEAGNSDWNPIKETTETTTF